MSTAFTLDNWYALAVIGGRENSIREDILKNLTRAGRSADVKEICFPDEEVVVDGGTAKERKARRGTLPGYLLIRARKLPDLTLAKIVDTKGVLGFMGGNDSPTTLGPNDLNLILGKDKSKAGQKARARFNVNDTVRITRGPMSDFTGVISELNAAKEQATVQVEIFGRATPAQISFGDLAPA